jgi:hypothetical protein
MSDIIKDVFEDIELKPNKSKIILKWVIRISVALIGTAFVFGQLKTSRFNKLNNIEETLQEQTAAIEELKSSMNDGFNKINIRIDKVYDDGYNSFNDFQQYNKKQLEIIVDYGQENKELVKKMLEVNSTEKTKNVETNLQQSKKENLVIIASKKNVHNIITIVSDNGKDTTYQVTGATKEYINKIDKTKYSVVKITPSTQYSGFFDLKYTSK